MQIEKLDLILPVLRCPRSGTLLSRLGDELLSESGERYPIVNGKPILVQTIRPLHVTVPPSNLVSQNIGNYSPSPEARKIAGFKVHLGSGNVPCADEDVISIDILPNTNVDVVAEAEHLPFATDSIAWVESGAVFEHLYDPLTAAAETRRVLAPGGGFYIDTAFMQGYHGFPSHYFNLTSQAVETFIVDDFELIESFVPITAGAAVSVENLLRKFVESLPAEERKRVLSMPTRNLLAHLSDPNKLRSIHEAMPEHIRRSLGASTCVIARKPADYSARRAVVGAAQRNAFQAAKRDYYATRVSVMQRHYEVEFYRSRSLECDPRANGPLPPVSLDVLLKACAPADTLSVNSLCESIEQLNKVDADLTSTRDAWIEIYLSTSRFDSALLAEPDELHVARLEKRVAELQRELSAVTSSRSWRITAHLRRAAAAIRLASRSS